MRRVGGVDGRAFVSRVEPRIEDIEADIELRHRIPLRSRANLPEAEVGIAAAAERWSKLDESACTRRRRSYTGSAQRERSSGGAGWNAASNVGAEGPVDQVLGILIIRDG